jgi:hypothetical protein
MAVAKDHASNTLFEWQKDELAAAAANRKLEGDDPASLAVVEPTKLTNQTSRSVRRQFRLLAPLKQ